MFNNGHEYWVQVIWGTKLGCEGQTPAVEGTITPIAVPSAPRGLVLTPAGGQIRVSWQPAPHSSAAPIEGYDITWSDSGGHIDTASVLRGVTAHTIGGLANGRAYSVEVHAYNTDDLDRVSYSAAINGTATPVVVPSAPTGLVLAPEDGQIRVSWQPAPHSSAAPVEEYYISWYTGTGAGSQPSALTPRGHTTYTINGLANGSAYRVFVYAVNAAGKSAHIWSIATPRATTLTTATHPVADAEQHNQQHP